MSNLDDEDWIGDIRVKLLRNVEGALRDQEKHIEDEIQRQVDEETRSGRIFPPEHLQRLHYQKVQRLKRLRAMLLEEVEESIREERTLRRWGADGDMYTGETESSEALKREQQALLIRFSANIQRTRESSPSTDSSVTPNPPVSIRASTGRIPPKHFTSPQPSESLQKYQREKESQENRWKLDTQPSETGWSRSLDVWTNLNTKAGMSTLQRASPQFNTSRLTSLPPSNQQIRLSAQPSASRSSSLEDTQYKRPAQYPRLSESLVAYSFERGDETSESEDEDEETQDSDSDRVEYPSMNQRHDDQRGLATKSSPRFIQGPVPALGSGQPRHPPPNANIVSHPSSVENRRGQEWRGMIQSPKRMGKPHASYAPDDTTPAPPSSLTGRGKSKSTSESQSQSSSSPNIRHEIWLPEVLRGRIDSKPMASRQRERQGSYSALPQPQKWPHNNRTGSEESVSRNVERSLAPLETAPRLLGPRQRSNDQNKKESGDSRQMAKDKAMTSTTWDELVRKAEQLSPREEALAPHQKEIAQREEMMAKSEELKRREADLAQRQKEICEREEVRVREEERVCRENESKLQKQDQGSMLERKAPLHRKEEERVREGKIEGESRATPLDCLAEGERRGEGLWKNSQSSKEEKRLRKQRVDEGEVREHERVEVDTEVEGRGEEVKTAELRREDEVDETLTEERVKDKQGKEKKDHVDFGLWEEEYQACFREEDSRNKTKAPNCHQNLSATDRPTNAPPSVPSATSSTFKTSSISGTFTANSTFEAILEEWHNHRSQSDDLLEFEGPITNILDQQGEVIKTIYAVLSSSDCASLIDLLHEMLKFENGLKDRRRLDRFLQRIVKETGQLPTPMIIDNVQKSGIHPLAGGGFADVYHGSQGDIEVAIKVLRVFGNKQVIRALCSEVLVWHRLSHSNVLPFLGVCVSEFAPRYALISPWMKNGHLLQYLRMHPESDRKAMMLGIASGLEYLHSLKPTVVHGDLRASNVLIGEDGQPMISDFGLSIIFDSQGGSVDRTSYKGEGSVRWQAPELLDPEQFVGITRGPTGKSDVYAFSCVCLEIFTEKAPFSDLREPEVMFKVVFSYARPPRPPEPAGNKGLSDEVWSLMQDCWAVRPNERPNMTTVVARIREITTISDREGS